MSLLHFLRTKLYTIRQGFGKDSKADFGEQGASYNEPKFSSFTPLTKDQVQELILSAPTKHCSLDPIPTSLLKASVDIVSPVITKVVNNSITSGKCHKSSSRQ